MTEYMARITNILILLCSILLIINHSYSFEEKEIETKEIKVSIDFEGVTHPYDEYDIKADFDGSVILIYPSNFEIIKASAPLMRIVTGEVAALLKTAKDSQERKDILRRWKNMFRYSDIKAPTDGIVVKIHVENDSYVKKGDKLITIAKKMRVIAKNTKPLKMIPIKGLDAIIETASGQRYKASLREFIKEANDRWRFFLDLESFPNIKVGERIKGILIVANKTATRVIPNSDIFEYGGKKYILVEFEPGLIDENDTEIISFKHRYLKISKELCSYVK